MEFSHNLSPQDITHIPPAVYIPHQNGGYIYYNQ